MKHQDGTNQSSAEIRLTKPKRVPLMKVNHDKLKHMLGVKNREVYIKNRDMQGTLCSDQTGKFPVQSRQGHNYIMVMVEIDSNAVIDEPMKTKSDKEVQHAYLALLAKLKRAKIVPLKHILDNEYSKSMTYLIRETCKLKLVPSSCHQRNVTEVAIKAFKQHFLSLLAGVASDFLWSLWDRLLPQVVEPTSTVKHHPNSVGPCTSL